MDVKNLDPKMFATPPPGPPPKPASGDGAPEPASVAALTVTTANIELKSKAKAAPSAPSAPSGPSSSAYRPQMPASSQREHVEGYVKAVGMEDHLPEYQYTMVTNSDGHDVPGILFNGVAYELELIGASDVESLAKAVRVDKQAICRFCHPSEQSLQGYCVVLQSPNG